MVPYNKLQRETQTLYQSVLVFGLNFAQGIATALLFPSPVSISPYVYRIPRWFIRYGVSAPRHRAFVTPQTQNQ